MPKPGQPAPQFALKDQDGAVVRLSDFKGKSLVLYFYPKDDTPGCTAEAQDFRDHYSEFQNLDTVVLGVSYDSQASHKAFKDKHKLPFPLLVDSDHKISQAYGAKGFLFASRDVFLISDQGKILKIFRSVSPNKAVELLLKDAQ